MNAVTTAEYIVLYEEFINTLSTELNTYAAQGYRLVQFTEVAANGVEDSHYTAVMVREPSPSAFADLLNRVGNLEVNLSWVKGEVETAEKRIEELEAKIDWSK